MYPVSFSICSWKMRAEEYIEELPIGYQGKLQIGDMVVYMAKRKLLLNTHW